MATVIKGSTSYTGHSKTISAHTDEAYSAAWAEFVFKRTVVLQALAIRAWNGMGGRYGNMTKTSGKGVRFDDGLQFSGRMAVSAPSSTLLTKGGVVNANPRDDYEGWAYDWFRLVLPMAIPEIDVQDNQGKAKLASLLADEMKLGNMGQADDVNKTFLNNSGAPKTNVGLSRLVSVTQTGSIGATSRTNAWWKNWFKPLTFVGAGGDEDKPILLKRALAGAVVGTSGFASVGGPDLLISNEGGYLTLARMSENLSGYVSTTKVEQAFQDLAIPHMLVDCKPIIYDPAATVPWGATASTDFIYGINTEVTGLAFKRQEYFRAEPWKAPNTRSLQRNYRANVFCRFTPYCTDRRANFVIYNMPANAEATSS